ncbi:MAG: hypothetical protein JO038_09170, partial [Alphaproteobacteria bacterium]|nr:hypothetical protein [Alphaproteobacteria bacterium]
MAEHVLVILSYLYRWIEEKIPGFPKKPSSEPGFRNARPAHPPAATWRDSCITTGAAREPEAKSTARVPGHEAGGRMLSATSLTPILIAGFGRSGTTALMAMLGQDRRVVMGRTYPFEDRYLTHLAKRELLLDRRELAAGMSGEQLCAFDDNH